MNKIDEKELHELFYGIKNEAEKSFTKLYKKYYNLIYGVMFSILKNKENSEDLTQIVFSKIYQLPKDKLPEKYEASWLYKVAKNEALQYIRKSKNEISIDEMYDVTDANNNIDEIIDIETYKKMIEGLSEKEKEIVSLKVLSQFTFKKIGQILKMPTGTVQWSYYRAVNSLKISISSLAGFVIAFILGITTTKQKKNNYVIENEENKKINEAEIGSNMDSTANANKEEIISSIESSIDSEHISKGLEITDREPEVNYISIGIFSVSFVFLIIFIIFFKKYQQKRKVKASKS